MLELLKNILNHYIFKKYSLRLNDPKDILPIILIIPTLIGGVWQLFELGNIGTPYIRFFSVTQLLPDGLLIIFIILGISLYLSNTTIIYERKGFEHNTKYSFKEIIFFICFNLILISGAGYLYYKVYKLPDTFSHIIYKFFLLYFIFRAVLYVFELFITISIKIKKTDPSIFEKILDDFVKQDYTKTFTRLFTILFFIFFLITIYFSFVMVRKFAYYPSNFENLTKLENELIKNFRLCEPPNLEYFNRDYLFYEIKIENKKRIYIIESKNLFISPLEPVIKVKKEEE